MSNNMIYGVNGFLIGVVFLIILFLIWFLYASYKELGMVAMWYWFLLSPKKHYKMVKNRMMNQYLKVVRWIPISERFFTVFLLIFLLFLVMIITIGLSIRFEINFLGL